MPEAWYGPDELKEEALTTKRQPEFDREVEEDPEDTSWDAMQALFDRHAEIQTAIDGITQSYPTVSGDDAVSL